LPHNTTSTKMKFLSKRNDSEILREGLVYKEGNTLNNRRLAERLLAEQHNFCAYTEYYYDPARDSLDVEHFDAELKGNDENYYNYYAVLHKSNQQKYVREIAPDFVRTEFFATRFFQDSEQFNARIQFVDNLYEEVNENDLDALNFIEYIGLNAHTLTESRASHVMLLREIFADARYETEEAKLTFFRNYPQNLNFITAIELGLGIDLSEFYQ